MAGRFWETKTLDQMNTEEWESLCDGCAKCCLLKLEDEDTGDIAYTRLHCRLLDNETCQCGDYENRKARVPDCVILKPESVAELKWMPRTCAYRLIHEGQPLPDWHHLISHDHDLVHRDGHSIKGRTFSEDTVIDSHQIDWIIDWQGNEP